MASAIVESDLVIVLRSIPYQERSRIVTGLAANHGKITAMARNSIQSRRFGSALDLFTAAQWQFVLKPQSEIHSVRSADVRESYEGIRKDFEKMALASAMNELILRLVLPQEPCLSLFRLHSNGLQAISELEDTKRIPELFNTYLSKLLQWSGSQPNFSECSVCQKPLSEVETDEVRVSISQANWNCCKPSGSTHQIPKLALIDYYQNLSAPIRQFQNQAGCEAHERLQKTLLELLFFHIPGFDRMGEAPIKSLRFFCDKTRAPRSTPQPQTPKPPPYPLRPS